MPPAASQSRLAYIDWMRGLACILMFQTHCYDAWLSPSARQTTFFMYSQLGGTFPAPLFLFLAGISFALVTEKLRQKNLAPSAIARTTILRGAEIFALGLLFRLQEYVLAWGWSPASDLLRVDILNTIGLSMMLMGLLCWLVLALSAVKRNMWGQPPSAVQPGEARQPKEARAPSLPPTLRQEPALSKPERSEGASKRWDQRTALIITSASVSLLISLLTPLLWTVWRPRWLPWPLESYIDGVHNLGTPQSWLFPVFPWSAFAFAGLAVGFILQSEWTRARSTQVFLSLGIAGLVIAEVARWLDHQPRQIYPVYDFWHTSPNFFLIRLGLLLMILTASYAWCHWGLAQRGFSPIIQLGQASLVVYWVHIEFVYGRFSILHKHAVGIFAASIGLVVIIVGMVVLAYLRTRLKGTTLRGTRLKGRGEDVSVARNRSTEESLQGAPFSVQMADK
jgi:uncharacterized membrane protein